MIAKNIVRNQINGKQIDKRYRNGIQGVRTYPGSHLGSDHQLEITLKKAQERKQGRPNFSNLKNQN